MTAACYLAAMGAPDELRAWLSSLVPPPGASQRLNRAFDFADLVIYAAPETEILELEEDKGLVIGRLFRGSKAAGPVTALSLSESRHAAWSSGRSLAEEKWGGYLAFVRDGKSVSVLRDPTGAVAAYHRQAGGIHLYTSHPELLGRSAPASAIDEEFLRQWLTHPFLRSARTGIEGWSELLPGTYRRMEGPASNVGVAWTPWKFVAPERRIHDFETAVADVREVTLATVAAQLAGIPSLILELSGGLDSSIVAACLKVSGLSFQAANFVTDMPDGDERDYARIVAAAVGAELAEIKEDSLPLDLSTPLSRTLRPPLSPVLQPLRRILSRHAREAGSSDFVTGAGGDNIFCYITTASPILDAYADLGFRGALQALQDVATLGECTLWKAGRFAARKRLRRARRARWARDADFLADAAMAGAPDPHPWLDYAEGVPSGKIEHVESLVRAQYFLEPAYESGETAHHPLVNQPLIELCLAIPSWLWVRGGRNRAVARAAFADLLPGEIIRRRTKGRLESMCARAYAANRRTLAELLLDGELSRRNLLDRRRIEAHLRAPKAPDDNYYRLFDLVSLELWLRSSRS
ncbi:MAG TPA: asparagine synthase C-terminal domain-containing protein [Allosphingosinicella sp.]|jgi:asparagine synthase (glutamine-hydrolysing)